MSVLLICEIEESVYAAQTDITHCGENKCLFPIKKEVNRKCILLGFFYQRKLRSTLQINLSGRFFYIYHMMCLSKQ